MMNSKHGQSLVSVVVPCFNHQKFVTECVRSIIDQSYRNIELIIIDDGSEDGSPSIIEKLIPECRSRFTRFEFRARPNRGLSATLNEGIEWCRGVYFSALASDDVMYPNKTSILVENMEREKTLAGIFSGGDAITGEGKIIDSIKSQKSTFSFEEIFLIKHRILAPTQLLRLNCLIEVGGYPDNLVIEDWYMWLVLTGQGYKLKIIEQSLVGYRLHGESYHKNTKKMLEGRLEVLNFFRDHPLYEKSLARVHLIACVDYATISKKQAIKYLLEAIASSWTVVFSRWGVVSLVAIIAPKVCLKYAKRTFKVFRLLF